MIPSRVTTLTIVSRQLDSGAYSVHNHWVKREQRVAFDEKPKFTQREMQYMFQGADDFEGPFSGIIVDPKPNPKMAFLFRYACTIFHNMFQHAHPSAPSVPPHLERRTKPFPCTSNDTAHPPHHPAGKHHLHVGSVYDRGEYSHS
jgi:hypothetical protein